MYCACVSGRASESSLGRLLLRSGQATEQPERDADHHDDKDELGDQEDEADRDTDEREQEHHQNLPQQDSDHTRGGDAENGLQNGQAPLGAPTLRQFSVRGVTADRNTLLTSSWPMNTL